MKSTSVKTDRISCRIAPEHKRLLERAASRRGLSVTDYLISTGLQAAHDELLAEEPIRLSPEDWEAVLAILDNPPEATLELKEAMAQFAKGTFDEGRYRS